MIVDRLLKSSPDDKLTAFKSGLYSVDNWLSELQVLTLQVSLFLAV